MFIPPVTEYSQINSTNKRVYSDMDAQHRENTKHIRKLLNDFGRMNNLKQHLFDEPGDTGKKDCEGTRIFAGDVLLDDSGARVRVFERGHKEFVVADTVDLLEHGYYPSLNLWLSMSPDCKVLAAEGTVDD